MNTTSMNQSISTDVVVIGAGNAGLQLAAHLVKNGLKVIILESRDRIGGVFAFSENNNIYTVNEITELTSGKHFTQMSDFTYEESGIEMEEFPSHWNYCKYLQKYAQHKGLLKCIKFNSKVSECRYDEKNCEWIIKTENNLIINSTKVGICSGLHSIPKPIPSKYHTFTGKLLRSFEIKRINPEMFRNKRILVIGGGETSVDLIMHHLPYVKQLIWSIRNGKYFCKKREWDSWANKWVTLDLQGWFLNVATKSLYRTFSLEWQPCAWIDVNIFQYDQHGIKEWQTDWSGRYAQLSSGWTKSGQVLKYVRDGTIIPKNDVQSIKGKSVIFKDGSVINNIDIIIFCGGFSKELKYLKIDKSLVEPKHLYEFVFPISDKYNNSLAMIGFVRPSRGSIPILNEVNSRWVASVWTQKSKLPNCAEMSRKQSLYLSKQAALFGVSAQGFKRNEHIISPRPYMRRAMKRLGFWAAITKHLSLYQRMRLYLSAPQTKVLKIFDIIQEPNSKIQLENLLNEVVYPHWVFFVWTFFARFGFKDCAEYSCIKIKMYLQEFAFFLNLFDWLSQLRIYKWWNNRKTPIAFTKNEFIKKEVIDYHNAEIIDSYSQFDQDQSSEDNFQKQFVFGVTAFGYAVWVIGLLYICWFILQLIIYY